VVLELWFSLTTTEWKSLADELEGRADFLSG
jgi:hypothetical protein